MSTIGIAYSGTGGSHNIVIDNFGDAAMPRSYVGSISYDLSSNGASILGGPAYRNKYQWVISTVVPKQTALDIDAMYQGWDADRANGENAACGITDETWGPAVNTSAVFVTSPKYTRLGPAFVLVSFGLQEV